VGKVWGFWDVWGTPSIFGLSNSLPLIALLELWRADGIKTGNTFYSLIKSVLHKLRQAFHSAFL